MNRLIVPATMAMLILCGAPNAEACACVVPDRTPDQERQDLAGELDRSAAVFAGRVTRVDRLTAQLDVELVWKGDVGDEVVMALHDGMQADGTLAFSSCDFAFQWGRSYLVFARLDTAGRMRAYYCTRTAELKQAQRTLALLEAMVTPRRIEPRDPRTPPEAGFGSAEPPFEALGPAQR